MSCDCHVMWGQSLLLVFCFFCERESQLGWGEGDHRHQCGFVEGEGEREKGREEGSMYVRTQYMYTLYLHPQTHIHMHIYVHVHTFVLCIILSEYGCHGDVGPNRYSFTLSSMTILTTPIRGGREGGRKNRKRERREER